MTIELLDTDKISSLSSLLGDDFIQIIDVFLATVPDTIQQVRQAHADTDTEELRKLLHSMKGSSGNIGAKAFSNKCMEYELVIKSGENNLQEAQVSQLEELFINTRDALTAIK